MSWNRAFAPGVVIFVAAALSIAQGRDWDSIYQDGVKAYERRDYAKAEALLSAAVREAERFGPRDPRLARSLTKLGDLYARQRRFKDAEVPYQRALGILHSGATRDSRDIAEMFDRMGRFYSLQDRHADSEAAFRRSLAMWQKLLGSEHVEITAAFINVANALVAQRKLQEAEPFYVRALAIVEKADPDHPLLAECLENLITLYVQQSDLPRTVPLHRRLVGVLERRLGADHPDVGMAVNQLAVALMVDHDEECLSLYKRSLWILEKAHGIGHPTVANALENIAILEEQFDRNEEAEEHFKRAIVAYEKLGGPDHSELPRVLRNYAGLLRTLKRLPEAEAMDKRAAIDERAGRKKPLR